MRMLDALKMERDVYLADIERYHTNVEKVERLTAIIEAWEDDIRKAAEIADEYTDYPGDPGTAILEYFGLVE